MAKLRLKMRAAVTLEASPKNPKPVAYQARLSILLSGLLHNIYKALVETVWVEYGVVIETVKS